MSEDILERHIRDGDVSSSEAGYYCNVCSASLGQQPLPHLHGSSHNNAIFLLTLSQPSRWRDRYNNIPENIRTALEKGEIVAKEKKVVCMICDVPLSKEKTVKDHLLSSIHVTNVASRAPPVASPQLVSPREKAAKTPFSSFLKKDESGFDQEAPSTTVERSDSSVTQALRDGHIKMVIRGGIDGFQCNVCGNTNMITGDAPMRQHLIGRAHLRNARRHELHLQQPNDAVAIHEPLSPPSRNVEEFSVRQLSLVDRHPTPSHQQTGPTRPQQNEFNYQPNSAHQQNPNYSQQNESNYQQNSTHQHNLYQGQRSDQQQYNIVNASPSININVNVGGSAPPPATTPQAGRGQTTNPYRIDSSPRGIVVVFNYYFEGKGKDQRLGAAMDYQNLHRVFTTMGYEVWPENKDLTKQETLDKLDDVRSYQQLEKVHSFVTFFLSHGGNTPDSFRTFEGGIISVEEILYTKFTDPECPQLRRKPKLFFFNFCRGKIDQLQSDSSAPSSQYAIAPKDVAVVQAALPHFAAKRHIRNGTLFVDCLCEVISEYARTLDLHDIVRKTSGLMQERGGTTATPWFIDFGKFYFQ